MATEPSSQRVFDKEALAKLKLKAENEVSQWDGSDSSVSIPRNLSIGEGAQITFSPRQRDQDSNKLPQKELKIDTVYLWSFCFTTVIGGQLYGWNEALEGGFASLLIVEVLMGLSFIIRCCSLAEIISCTGFSGGSYGMTRIVIGFYPGFIVAFFELAEYLTYTSMSVVYIGQFICGHLNLNEEYDMLIWFVFFITAGFICTYDTKLYWISCLVIALYSLIIVIIFVFGSIEYTNFQNGASFHIHSNPSSPRNWFAPNVYKIMQTFPYSTWALGDIESSSLITELLHQPKKTYPLGVILGAITLFVTMMFILFVSVSVYDNLEAISMEFILNRGFQKMGISIAAAEWFVLFPQYGMAFGFMLPAGKLIHAMSTSHMFPNIFHSYQWKDHRPAMLIVCVVCYLLCLVNFYFPLFDLNDIAILFGFMSYMVDLSAYMKLKIEYPNLKRKYKSPFGITGAVFAGFVYLCGFIAVVGFSDNNKAIIVVTVGYTFFLSIYYYFYASNHQVFSEMEKNSFMTLYLVKFNKMKRERVKHHHHYHGIHSLTSSNSNQSLSSTLSSYLRLKSTKTPRQVKVPITRIVPIKEDNGVEVISSTEQPDSGEPTTQHLWEVSKEDIHSDELKRSNSLFPAFLNTSIESAFEITDYYSAADDPQPH
jgi:ethanolamine permease